MGILVDAKVNRLGKEVKAALKTASTSRIYFLDNLKVLLALLMVLDAISHYVIRRLPYAKYILG